MLLDYYYTYSYSYAKVQNLYQQIQFTNNLIGDWIDFTIKFPGRPLIYTGRLYKCKQTRTQSFIVNLKIKEINYSYLYNILNL